MDAKETKESNNDPVDDPVVTALTQRTKDLSRTIINPKTLAVKLRESLADIAGKDSVAYHIGIVYDSESRQAKVEISKLSPHFVIKLGSDLKSADLSMAYMNQTSGGWKVAVGLTVSDSFDKRRGSGIVASFAVTISR